MIRNRPLKQIFIRHLTVSSLLCLSLLAACFIKPQAVSLQNPINLHDEDLIGVWETKYTDGGQDELIIGSDRTFIQIYINEKQNHHYETLWNPWWLEYLQDGGVRLHLLGARYYLNGISWNDQNGSLPFDFYDPFIKTTLHVGNELVLAVLKKPSGNLILHHMWTSTDRGFVLFGGKTEFLTRTSLDIP